MPTSYEAGYLRGGRDAQARLLDVRCPRAQSYERCPCCADEAWLAGYLDGWCAVMTWTTSGQWPLLVDAQRD